MFFTTDSLKLLVATLRKGRGQGFHVWMGDPLPLRISYPVPHGEIPSPAPIQVIGPSYSKICFGFASILLLILFTNKVDFNCVKPH